MSAAVECPYCNAVNGTPDGPRDGVLTALPFARMPYRRSKWSQVGRDFHSWSGWDRFGPGILRVKDGQCVHYTVIECQACKHPFDVYSSKGSVTLNESWPYLFESYEETSGLLIRLSRILVTNNDSLFALAVASFVLVFFFCSLPELFSTNPYWFRMLLALVQAVPVGALMYCYLKITKELNDTSSWSALLMPIEGVRLRYLLNFQRLRYTGIPANERSYHWTPSQKSLVGCTGLLAYVIAAIVSCDYQNVVFLDLFDALCWGLYCYYFYSALWICFGGPTYVAELLVQLPYRTTAYDEFESLRPVDTILSVSFLPILVYTISFVFVSYWSASSHSALYGPYAVLAVVVCLGGMFCAMSRLFGGDPTLRTLYGIIVALGVTVVLLNQEWLSSPLFLQVITVTVSSTFLLSHLMGVTKPIAGIRESVLRDEKERLSREILLIHEKPTERLTELRELVQLFSTVEHQTTLKTKVISMGQVILPIVALLIFRLLTMLK